MNKEDQSLKCQTCVLKVNINCESCKRMVKRILCEIEGVYKVEAEFGKVRVFGNADPQTLIDKLVKKGKRAELILVAPKPDNQPSQIDNSNGGGKKKKKKKKKGNIHLQIDNGAINGNEGGNCKKEKNVQIGNGNGRGGDSSDKLNLVQNETDDAAEIDSAQLLINKRSGKKPMIDVGQGSGQSMPNTILMMKNGNYNNIGAGKVGVNGNYNQLAGGGILQSQSYGYPHNNMSMANHFQTTQGNYNYMPMGNFQTTQMQGNCPTTSQIMSNCMPVGGNFEMTQMGNNSIGNFGTTDQMGNLPMSNIYQTTDQVAGNNMTIGNFLTSTQMGTLPIDQMAPAHYMVPPARGGYINPMINTSYGYQNQQQRRPHQMVDNNIIESFQLPMMMITQSPQHVNNYMTSQYSYDHEAVDHDKNNPSCNVM